MPPDDNINRIDIAEFQTGGYLQEVNRRFLHPLGLALEVEVDAHGAMTLGGIWDYREDADGINFGGAYSVLGPKADRIDEIWREREPARVAAVGYMVQPTDPDTLAHVVIGWNDDYDAPYVVEEQPGAADGQSRSFEADVPRWLVAQLTAAERAVDRATDAILAVAGYDEEHCRMATCCPEWIGDASAESPETSEGACDRCGWTRKMHEWGRP